MAYRPMPEPEVVPRCSLCSRRLFAGRGCIYDRIVVETEYRARVRWASPFAHCPGCGTPDGEPHHGGCPRESCVFHDTIPLVDCGHPVYYAAPGLLCRWEPPRIYVPDEEGFACLE